MAHIYHGKDTLILTDVQKQDFPSGLSRIDATYKCRTTEADNLAPLLAAGNRMPEYPAYIIRQNPTRETGQDGFTTFKTSSFAGTLSTSAGVQTIFGASIGDFTINYTEFLISNYTTFSNLYIFNFKILSDTITRTFTMLPNVSVTTLATPVETVSFKVLGGTFSLGGAASESSFLSRTGSSLYSVIGKTQIINVNRQSFGGVDEVQVTWGLAPGEYPAGRTIIQNTV
jgi:hypothetical protein